MAYSRWGRTNAAYRGMKISGVRVTNDHSENWRQARKFTFSAKGKQQRRKGKMKTIEHKKWIIMSVGWLSLQLSTYNCPPLQNTVSVKIKLVKERCNRRLMDLSIDFKARWYDSFIRWSISVKIKNVKKLTRARGGWKVERLAELSH